MSTAAKQPSLARLEAICETITDPNVLESYRRDQTPAGFANAGEPAALVRPACTEEVEQIVAFAASSGLPVVPRGAGSGLSGGANAIDGCIVVSLERMNRILSLDAGAMTATVQPGVLNSELKAAAGTAGLFYPPDPASSEFSTIGGNVATNAGGLCCVKYGVTRESLLALEVVLADGRPRRLGRRTRKGVVGYDLCGLMCGSGGTLGLITEVTVRLQPPPAPVVTLAASFADIGTAGHAIESIVTRCRPSLLEIMDSATLRAVEDLQPMDLETGVAALLFAQSDAGGAAAVAEVGAMQALCDEAGATLSLVSDDVAEGRMMMAARRLAYPALERMGKTVLDDVCVPLNRITDLLLGIAEIADERELIVGTFGHAGDGNMHPTIVVPEDPDGEDRVRAAFESIIELAWTLGGTATGEHGVGALKSRFVDRELSASHDVHLAIKHALDPGGVMNPGRPF